MQASGRVVVGGVKEGGGTVAAEDIGECAAQVGIEGVEGEDVLEYRWQTVILVLAYIVMAYTVIAYIVMGYIVLACTFMAYTVMADILTYAPYTTQ